MNNAGSVYEIKAVPMEEDCDFLIDRLSEELAIVKVIDYVAVYLWQLLRINLTFAIKYWHAKFTY